MGLQLSCQETRGYRCVFRKKFAAFTELSHCTQAHPIAMPGGRDKS